MPLKSTLLTLFASFFIFFGCSPKKESKILENQTAVSASEPTHPEYSIPLNATDMSEIYFTASGLSPEWTLDIAADRIRLQTGGDTLNTPHTVPDRAMDANVKRYRPMTEATEMNVEIRQGPCESESGISRPYSVQVKYKHTGESKYTTLSGCGAYVMEYRLHDIWALESLNGDVITLAEGLERPYFEIDSRKSAFMGSTSCNQMRGTLFFEPGLLRFNEVLTTRKMCPGGLEAEFLKTLQSTIHYKLENGRLTLTNPSGAELVFRKVD